MKGLTRIPIIPAHCGWFYYRQTLHSSKLTQGIEDVFHYCYTDYPRRLVHINSIGGYVGKSRQQLRNTACDWRKPAWTFNRIMAICFIVDRFYLLQSGGHVQSQELYWKYGNPYISTQTPSLQSKAVHFMWCLMSDLAICKHKKEHCHTWHQMSLQRPGVIEQDKLNLAGL